MKLECWVQMVFTIFGVTPRFGDTQFVYLECIGQVHRVQPSTPCHSIESIKIYKGHIFPFLRQLSQFPMLLLVVGVYQSGLKNEVNNVNIWLKK